MTAGPGAEAAGAAGSPEVHAAPLAVEADRLVKDYGFRRVLDEVSLRIPHGTFFTLFGPNGAGKTTLVKILTGVSRPTSGTARIAGLPARGAASARTRARIGFLSHQTLVYDGLTGLENLLFFAGLYGLADARMRAEALLRELRLWERRDDLAGTYSRGMLQRLAIARALLHDPETLLLDEPFTGLDPAAARLLTDLLGRLRQGGRSALIVTHDLEEGLALSDRWGILAGGRIVAEGDSPRTTLRELERMYFDVAGAHLDADGSAHA